LREGDTVVAVVEMGDNLAGGDMFIVGDGDGGDIAGHFRSERGLPRCDESVVGGFEMSAVIQVDVAAGKCGGEKDGTDSGDNGAAMHHALVVLLAVR
jgi:hypothetical protein